MNFIQNSLISTQEGTQQIEGKIIEVPRHTDFSTEIILDIEKQVSNIQVKIPKTNNLRLGDTIKIKGELSRVENENTYNKYLQSKKIFYIANKVEIIEIKKQTNFLSTLLDFKVNLEKSFDKKLSERSSNFLMGILIGASSIDKEEKEAFQNIGISHIVSVSGSNVLFIYILINTLALRTLNKKFAIITSSILISAYVYIVGFYNIPAFRALIIIILYLLAKLLGRKINYPILINLSCLIMIINNPYIIHNVSFLLSLSAVIGLVLFASRANYLFEFLPDVFREVLIVTIIANLSTLYISYISFGKISLVTLFTNFLILPVIPVLMVLGVIFYSISFNNLLLTPIILLIQAFTGYIFKVVDLFNNLSFASTSSLLLVTLIGASIITIFLILDVNDFKKRTYNK